MKKLKIMPFLVQQQKSTAYELLKWINYQSKISKDTTDQTSCKTLYKIFKMLFILTNKFHLTNRSLS